VKVVFALVAHGQHRNGGVIFDLEQRDIAGLAKRMTNSRTKASAPARRYKKGPVLSCPSTAARMAAKANSAASKSSRVCARAIKCWKSLSRSLSAGSV